MTFMALSVMNEEGEMPDILNDEIIKQGKERDPLSPPQ